MSKSGFDEVGAYFDDDSGRSGATFQAGFVDTKAGFGFVSVHAPELGLGARSRASQLEIRYTRGRGLYWEWRFVSIG